MALAANAPMMTKAGVVDGQVEAGILPTGQVVGVDPRAAEPWPMSCSHASWAKPKETLARLAGS